MDRSKLLTISDRMKSEMGADLLLEALELSLSADVLEDHLRYIDRMYETHQF